VVPIVLGTARRCCPRVCDSTLERMEPHALPAPSNSSARLLAGRTAVVTGAASGIGAATARRLAADGARVALIARRADRLHALADELGAERALAVPADVTDPGGLERAAGEVADRFGPVDLVVAGAGVMLPGPVEELRSEEWRRMVDLNLVGVLETVRVFLPGLLDAATRRDVADLLLISSLGARATFPGYAVYGATKAAVSYLAAAWRAELAPRGVRVSAIEPGLTHSELADQVAHREQARELEGMFEQISALHAGDVADLIAYTAALPARASLPTVPILPARQA
jgi:NADP-dependent 3-hydroxy acid dehydrogenase YdfG